MPGYGLVPIEDQNAPPVKISVGEGQQEAMEAIAMNIGPGGVGHMYLKTEAQKDNRPPGCVIMDVELVGLDQNRGPGSEGWKGWQSLISERQMGDQWLEEADGGRKKLETFGTLSKSTGQTKDAEAHVAAQVHKFGNNATRRYRRALKWLEADNQEDNKIKMEKCTVSVRLAKAMTITHSRFGEAAEAEPAEQEKEALAEAKTLLAEVLVDAEALGNDNLAYECLKMTLAREVQAQDVTKAREVLEQLLKLRPDDDDLKSDSARINKLEGVLNLKKGAGAIEDVQKALQAAVTGNDLPKATECLEQIKEMIQTSQVTWDTVRTLKVGKDVGNAMKMGDPDVAAIARKCVAEIQVLAQKGALGY